MYIALLQDGTPGEPSVDPPGLWLQHKRGQYTTSKAAIASTLYKSDDELWYNMGWL